MKRQIKFRVWDKQSNCWIDIYNHHDWIGTGIGNAGTPDIQPWTCMSLIGEIMSNDNQGAFVDSNQENYIIQQYTGLLDKNGKEIYEGDILKRTFKGYNRKTDEIWFGNVEFSKYEDSEGYASFYHYGWIIKYPAWSYCFTGKSDTLVDKNNITVVTGNIIENPELLLPIKSKN